MLRKIVSGGQTGVDRGALDAALCVSFPCGGWCPEGRQAEDGPIPERYPVRVLAGADYPRRTRQNVVDSDGTLIISFGEPSGGTLGTVQFCEQLQKPVLVVDALKDGVDDVAGKSIDFIHLHSIHVLNVAGPRESKDAGAAAFAKLVVGKLLARERCLAT